MDSGKHICISTVGRSPDIPVGAGRTGPEIIRGSIELISKPVGIVVKLHTAGYIKPVGYIPCEGCAQHVTLLVILAELAVLHPVRVLHTDVVVSVRPVVDIVSEGSIIALVHLHILEAFTPREQIKARERVVIYTLRHEVAVILLHEAGRKVKGKLVLGKLGRVASSEVVAVVGAVRKDSGGVGRRNGQISLVLVIAGGKGCGRNYVRPSLEIVAGIEIRIDLRSPA